MHEKEIILQSLTNEEMGFDLLITQLGRPTGSG